MAAPRIAPYGCWKSPIAAAQIAAATLRLGQVQIDGSDIYWSEGRPADKGRNVLVRRAPTGTIRDVLPTTFNVRSRVHEYGGGAFAVRNGTVYFSHDGDRALYRRLPGEEPEAIAPGKPYRYADIAIDPARPRVVCVRETHRELPREPVNELVAIASDGQAPDVRPLVTDFDFVSSPRFSPDGRHLSWLSWERTQMPWDGSQVWVATVVDDGSLKDVKCIAGNSRESIFQPEWSPDGILHFVSDRSGWWNLYRYRAGQVEPLCNMAAEFGLPQWVFGMSTYGFASRDLAICTYSQNGIQHLAALDTQSQQLTPISAPYISINSLQVGDGFAAFVGASATTVPAIVRLDLVAGQCEELQQAIALDLDPAYWSRPHEIDFPTTDGAIAHGFYYPPTHPDYTTLGKNLPPLLVKSHSGPTGAASAALDLRTQYWTSRGFAVLDVNYGGSTGYGRAYRDRLLGQWGVVDVDDCTNGARYLVERGWVDGDRLVVRGSSAGGFTTLAALTFQDVFKAGAVYYGISDLEGLLRDTHKFEARYFDRIVGPHPQERETYVARSPIHHPERLSCPVIFFQGSDDVVTPPAQAASMVSALRSQGIPVAHLVFAGEQHGFRRAETIQRCLEAELYFYARIFGLKLPEAIEPVDITTLS
ncbi:MAG: prolyl oligopeptidase family serine peptidase [Cyanobacteria bacterium J06648_11]